MKNIKYDILDLEYSSTGRDINIVEPVLSYLELKYDLKVVRKWCFGNIEWYLLKYKPKMVIIANGIGSIKHFKIVKLASKLGIKVVTLISEGDLKDDKNKLEQMFWGWNKDKYLFEDLHVEWSEKNVKLINKYIKNSNNFPIKVSGATGFDRYKILSFLQKEDFIRRYKINKYKKIIGLAGWGFDKFIGKYYDDHKDILDSMYEKKDIEIYRKSKEQLKQIYKKLITENPDILFVLKFHPLCVEVECTEFYQLDKYQNTIKIVNEENIEDILNICDIWGAFESTTCLEAWLLGKKTFLINPVSSNFFRSKIAKGSPIYKTYDEVQSAIDLFYKINKLPGFKKLEKYREENIKNLIQWGDGKNHIRAAEYIYELFQENIKKKRKIDSYVIRIYLLFIVKILIKDLLYFILRIPPIRYIKAVKEFNKKVEYVKKLTRFDSKERLLNRDIYKDALIKFYKKNKIKY